MQDDNERTTEERNAKTGLYLSLAFLVLVISLVAILYTYNRSWFEMPEPDVFRQNKTYRVTLADTGPREGLWLSGYPAFASFEVPLPQDVVIEQAELELVIEVNMNPDVDADLRITVNNQRLHEEYLDPDRKLLRLRFSLGSLATTGDSDRLRIGLSTRGGMGSDLLCPADINTGIILRVRSQSFVQMDFDQPVYSVRDTLALMPRKVVLAMPVDTDNAPWIEQAAALGVALRHAGFEPRFLPLSASSELFPQVQREGLVVLGHPQQLAGFGYLPEGQTESAILQSVFQPGREFLAVTHTDVAELLTLLSPALSSFLVSDRVQGTTVNFKRHGEELQQELPLSVFGADTEVQQLRSHLRWELPYSLADFPGGRLPEMLNLLFKMPAPQEDYYNMVHVELNGKLLDSTTTGYDDIETFHVALPREEHRLRNKLVVEMQRNQAGNACSRLTIPFPVQLMEPSSFGLRENRHPGQASSFLDLLEDYNENNFDVRLPVRMLGEGAPEVLTVLLPVLNEFMALGQWPRFLWVGPGDSEIPRRPYIALQHVPSGTDVKIEMHGNQLFLNNPGENTSYTLSGIGKAMSLEIADTYYPVDSPTAETASPDMPEDDAEPRQWRYHVTHGLVVMYTDPMPDEISLSLGHESALIFSGNAPPIQILPDGSILNYETARTDHDINYELR